MGTCKDSVDRAVGSHRGVMDLTHQGVPTLDLWWCHKQQEGSYTKYIALKLPAVLQYVSYRCKYNLNWGVGVSY